jgi:hypothetical protein
LISRQSNFDTCGENVLLAYLSRTSAFPFNEEFPGPYTQEKKLSINDLLKPTPKCIEINNGVVYEIRKNSFTPIFTQPFLVQHRELPAAKL